MSYDVKFLFLLGLNLESHHSKDWLPSFSDEGKVCWESKETEEWTGEWEFGSWSNHFSLQPSFPLSFLPCVCCLSWPALCDPTDYSLTGWLLCPWNFPGKSTGVRCHFQLQGIFPTQGPNSYLLCLLHWQVDSLPLSHLGSPPTYLGHKISKPLPSPASSNL